MGPPKIDVVGKKHNNSLNHASKTKQKQSHTDTVSRLTKEEGEEKWMKQIWSNEEVINEC